MLSDADFTRKQNELDREIQKLEDQKLRIINKLKILKQEKEELRHRYSLDRLKNRPDTSKWLSQEYAWTKKVHDVLKNTFKFEMFRPSQLAAINATLSKKHVLLVMPTGGGKSLIYQLPAVVTGNLTVVISPLIALIEDQLMALKRLGISGATVNANTPKEEKKEVTAKMLGNKLNLIFVTPEWIARTKAFMNNLTKIHKEGHLARFVIDEVHCCSQWGHDFRTDYLSLSLLKGQFPGVPILGLTATATSNVMVDIQKILEIPDAVIITAPYNRPNLFYRVVNKPESKSGCLDYLEKLIKDKFKDQSGIIYAGTQKDCEDLATDLRNRGIRAAPYHANIEADVKSKIHRKWTENSYQCVVATIAFGMGIDKPDVRFVIHYTVPKALEGLYQESGRAGRDGKRADCILMFNLTDWLRNFAMAKNKREEKSVTDVLDYCIDVSTDILKLIDCASQKETNLTLKKLLDAWFQTGPKNIQSNSKPQFTREQAEHILAFLLNKNFLTVRRGYSLVSTLAYIDTNNDQPFDKSKFGGKILMEYCGTLKGVPVVDSEKVSVKSADAIVKSEKKENTFERKSNYTVKETLKSDEDMAQASGSRIDLTSDNSDDDVVELKEDKSSSKRPRRISSSSSDDESKSSVNSLNDFEFENKKKKK